MPQFTYEQLELITHNEIQALIDDRVSESEVLDYKQDFIELPKVSKCLSAFANKNGGCLVFGIREDDNRVACEIIGVDNADHQLDRIRTHIRNAIAPTINIRSTTIRAGDHTVALIATPSSTLKPHVHKDGDNWTYNSRNDAGISRASPEEIRDMVMRSDAPEKIALNVHNQDLESVFMHAELLYIYVSFQPVVLEQQIDISSNENLGHFSRYRGFNGTQVSRVRRIFNGFHGTFANSKGNYTCFSTGRFVTLGTFNAEQLMGDRNNRAFSDYWLGESIDQVMRSTTSTLSQMGLQTDGHLIVSLTSHCNWRVKITENPPDYGDQITEDVLCSDVYYLENLAGDPIASIQQFLDSVCQASNLQSCNRFDGGGTPIWRIANPPA